MNDIDIKKTKFKFDLSQFITILIFVFGLGTAWASLNSKQTQIMEKLDEVVALNQDMVATRDSQHSEIDKQLARLTPTVHTIAKKLGLE